MNLIFMGTPDFAVAPLLALHEAGHKIAAVYCQPPKPQGRGKQIQKTPVHLAAEGLGLPVRTPLSLKNEEEIAFLRAEDPDAIIVAAYGLILPAAVLEIPRYGCINIHASLLPRWRGAAPIQRAILAGDGLTGVTIMQMDPGLDTGPMLATAHTPITNETTAEDLHHTLAQLGADLIVPTLEGVARGAIKPTPQPEVGALYAAKLTRADSAIDWEKDAFEIERQIRALTPWPGTSFALKGETIKVLEAELVAEPEQKGKPGTLLDEAFTVACGAGALRLKKVQRAGKAPTDGASFLRGLRLPVGSLIA
jgi:methionyl-tRNA formyltransferase